MPSAEALFAALDGTWPAARFLEAGRWTLREGLGGGQRVSAATARAEVDESDIAEAEDGMRGLGQRPLFMIRQGDAALDQWLDGRGYDIVDPVTMYCARSEDLAGELPMIAAIPCWPPLAVQLEIWERGGIGPARIAVMERAGEKTSALGRHKDTPCGSVFVARHGDIAMLHALEVAPDMRRHGVGRSLVTACANWAVQKGSGWFALAVTTGNAAANALYRGAGMQEAARYHYRRAQD